MLGRAELRGDAGRKERGYPGALQSKRQSSIICVVMDTSHARQPPRPLASAMSDPSDKSRQAAQGQGYVAVDEPVEIAAVRSQQAKRVAEVAATKDGCRGRTHDQRARVDQLDIAARHLVAAKVREMGGGEGRGREGRAASVSGREAPASQVA